MKHIPSWRCRARRQKAASARTSRGVSSRKPTTSRATQPASSSMSEQYRDVPWGCTVEWQRKPNMIMARAGVRMMPKMMVASPPLISAMIIFCAVTSTEHAQQSREPLNSSGGSAAASLPPIEYGGGTTTPDPALEGEPSSEWPCSDIVFSSVPFRDRLIFLVVSVCGKPPPEA